MSCKAALCAQVLEPSMCKSQSNKQAWSVRKSLVFRHLGTLALPLHDEECSPRPGTGFCVEDIMVNSKANPVSVKMLGIWYASTAVNQRGLCQ